MAEPQPHDEAGYAKPFTEEEVEGFRRDWRRLLAEEAPEIPPVGNIGLALELCGAEPAERTHTLHGHTFRLLPLSYADGLRLTRHRDRLKQLLALKELLGRVENLAELGALYAEMRQVFRAVMRPLEGEWPATWERQAEPFYDLLAGNDYPELIDVLLEPGDECPIPPPIVPVGTHYRRYNAAHGLFTYLKHFGAVPDMVVNGQPASWRHYQAAQRWWTHEEAQATLSLFGAFCMPQVGDKPVADRWIRELQRRAGELG